MAKKILLILFCIFSLGISSYRASAQDAGEDVKSFLARLENAINSMDTYKFTLKSENWKGKKHEKKVIEFYFKKPNLMRTDVLAGKKRGSRVVLNKEGKIRGRNSWGFKKTLKPTDKRLKSIRGSTFMNASFLDKIARLKEHILKRGCIATVAEEEYEGNSTYHLHISHNDTDDPVTGEDIWFEKKTYLMLRNLKFENEDLVADAIWEGAKINIPLKDSLFE